MPDTHPSSASSPLPATRHWKLLLAMPLLAAAMLVAPKAQAQAYVNVTVGGAFAPGVYGQVVIGNNPPPPVVNVQPLIVGAPVYGVQPLYLYVPVNHQREWGRYCTSYRACGYPVYFVQVDPRNRWWEHHNQYLRGEGHYRREDWRHERRERHNGH